SVLCAQDFLVPKEAEVALDPLELELQACVSHRVGAENITHVLCKGSQRSHLLAHLSSLLP
ncbi:hypothetical protein ACQP3J_30035, partial [Escherichia coli]